MKLFEISTATSKNQFVSIMNGLVVELHNIAISLEGMTDDGHGDILKRHMASRTARWFSTNFPAILSASSALKQVDPVFSEIAKIGVTSFTSSSNKSDLTKSNGFHNLMNVVQRALTKLGADSTAIKLANAEQKCINLIDAGRAEYNAGAASVKAASAKTPKDDLKGKQNSAVESMINDVIKNLPPERQHAARQAVSKADNKIQALQAFLNKNGA